MKISDITIDLIKEHCGISGDDSNALIEVYKSAALAANDMLNGNLAFVVVDEATAKALVSSITN